LSSVNWLSYTFATSKLTLNHTKIPPFSNLTGRLQTPNSQLSNILPLVLQVRFHPVQTNKLLSSSVDGLVCVFDTSGKLDDEDCMETVLPVNTSVSSFGFYGPSGENVWCLTNVETLRQVLIAVCSVLGEFGVSSLAYLSNQRCSSLSMEVGDKIAWRPCLL
jgi:hypothetical protein